MRDAINIVVAIVITLIVAIYGTMLSSDGMEAWYPSLHKPLDIPLVLFISIQILYYIITVTILFRLLSHISDKRIKIQNILILILFMFMAETWNYFFFGMRNLLLSFMGMVVLGGTGMVFYLLLRKTEKWSSRIFAPYLLWLVFVDIPWIAGIWLTNP